MVTTIEKPQIFKLERKEDMHMAKENHQTTREESKRRRKHG